MNKLELARTKIQQALEIVISIDKLFWEDPNADPDMRADIFDAQISIRRARSSVLTELHKSRRQTERA